MADHRIVGHDQQRRIESPSEYKAGQQVVRDERLQKILEGFYDEVGQRTATLLQEYHKLFGEPMGLRIAYLEMSWLKRRWLDIVSLKEVVVTYFKSGRTSPTPEVDGTASLPPTGAEVGPSAAPAGVEPASSRGAEGAPSLLP